MRHKNNWLLLCLSFFAIFLTEPSARAQDRSDFYKFREEVMAGMKNFRKNIYDDYKAFRDKINADYAAFLRGEWAEGKPVLVEEREQDPVPQPPVVFPEEDRSKPVESNPVIVDEVIDALPEPEPAPQPVVPVKEDKKAAVSYHYFTYLGQTIKVRLSATQRFSLGRVDNEAIAGIWEKLSAGSYDNLLYDCLALRTSLSLCDWAYFQMLCKLADSFLGEKTDAAVMLAGYLYCQSGYRIRLAVSGGRLHVMVASPHRLVNRNIFKSGEQNYFFYPECENSSFQFCDASFEGEKTMNLYVQTLPVTDMKLSPKRELASRRYPAVSVASQVDMSLQEFYDSYPASRVGDNICTQWAMYAQTPFSPAARRTVLEPLRRRLEGYGETEALERILNFVQTAFEYGYDDTIWGGDRAFFPDETLFYPYSDCEDRAILFTRLVSDILGLESILVLYPEHLAAAVKVKHDIPGDYIMLGNEKYIVCDPTYIGASAGRTMPDMDNTSAKVIRLDNPVKYEDDYIVENDEEDVEESIPFAIVEEKPSFKGGDASAFSKWVNERLVYPESAKKNGIQGRVTLQFTIETDGSVFGVKVLRGVNPALDEEAVRVVSMSPKWIPGKHRDRAVRVTYTFPVIFQLKI